MTLGEALAHLRLIAGAVSVPVNADFEGGYAVAPAEVAVNVALAVDTGIAGLSIEDASHDLGDPLLAFDGSAEGLVDLRVYAASVAVGFMMSSNSTGVSFPSLR